MHTIFSVLIPSIISLEINSKNIKEAGYRIVCFLVKYLPIEHSDLRIIFRTVNINSNYLPNVEVLMIIIIS